MFFSVIAAYVLAAAFAFCGVMNVVTCISNAKRELGYPVFIETLGVAMWPLAVAIALVLLVQIGCLIEKILFLETFGGHDEHGEEDSPARPTQRGRETPTAGATAPRTAAQPAPAFNYGAAPVPAVTPPMMADKPDSTPQPQEQPAQEAATPRQPSAPQQDTLSFFKLD